MIRELIGFGIGIFQLHKFKEFFIDEDEEKVMNFLTSELPGEIQIMSVLVSIRENIKLFNSLRT